MNEPFNSQENQDRIYPCNNNTKTTTKTTEGLLVVPGNIACSEVKSWDLNRRQWWELQMRSLDWRLETIKDYRGIKNVK